MSAPSPTGAAIAAESAATQASDAAPGPASFLASIPAPWRTIGAVAAGIAAVGLAAYLFLGADDNSSPRKKGKGRRRGKGKRDGKAGVTAAAEAAALPNDVLLEEISPPPSSTSKAAKADGAQIKDKVRGVLTLTPSDIDAMPVDGRKEAGNQLKTEGNRLFQKKQFALALECYSQAILMDPENAVYYANRAACRGNQGDQESCIDDCNAALQRDPKYVKALNRRAVANEKLGKLEASLNDFTAICMLENFSNDAAGQAMDRVLKALTEKEAVERVKGATSPNLPNGSVLQAYMESFQSTKIDGAFPDAADADAEPAAESTDSGEAWYRLAERHMKNRKFEDADTCYIKACEHGCSNMARALVMRGTFRFVRGESQDAVADFNKAREADPTNIEAIVKLAGLWVEIGDVDRAMSEFNAALTIDDKSPDVYYHRGQVRYLTGDIVGAAEDYTKSIELDNSMPFAHIQLGVALYREGKVANALAMFRRTLKQFPTFAPARNYYAELLIDGRQWQEAEQVLDEAIRLDPNYGLAWVNRATLVMQWRQDMAEMERCLVHAKEVDPTCELAVVQLAQINLSRNQLSEALENFETAAKLARTPQEMAQIVEYIAAVRAQLAFAMNFPEDARRLRELSERQQAMNMLMGGAGSGGFGM